MQISVIWAFDGLLESNPRGNKKDGEGHQWSEEPFHQHIHWEPCKQTNCKFYKITTCLICVCCAFLWLQHFFFSSRNCCHLMSSSCSWIIWQPAQRELCHNFNIHRSTVSRILVSWSNFCTLCLDLSPSGWHLAEWEQTAPRISVGLIKIPRSFLTVLKWGAKHPPPFCSRVRYFQLTRHTELSKHLLACPPMEQWHLPQHFLKAPSVRIRFSVTPASPPS